MQPRTSSQKPAATTTLFQWKSPRMRTEASAVVDSTIADTSTSPRMTRTMVLMFMAPQPIRSGMLRKPERLGRRTGRHQAAFQSPQEPLSQRPLVESRWHRTVVRSPHAYFANAAAFRGPPEGCCGIQNEPPAGGITAWIDYGSRTEKATFYGTIVGDQQVWPAANRMLPGCMRWRTPVPPLLFTPVTEMLRVS